MSALEGKVVLITGAAGGLGRAYALDAVREGASVVVNDIDEDVLLLAAEIRASGGRAIAVKESVATWDGSARIVKAAMEEFERLDGLVNNAGVLHIGQPWLATESEIRESLEINVLGSLFVGTHVIKVMVDQGHGSIVNSCSAGHLGAAGRAAYVAAEGALASLTYGWSVDLAPYGIRVNAFAGSAETAMSRLNPTPVLGLPSPEANAPMVSYLLSDLSEGISGQLIYKYKDGFMVFGHPSPTEFHARVRDDSVARVVEEFDPVLRAGLQPVGWILGGGKSEKATQSSQ